MRIVTAKYRPERCTMALSDAFADVAAVLAPAFELVDDADDHTEPEPLEQRPRLQLVPAAVNVRHDIPTPPWGEPA